MEKGKQISGNPRILIPEIETAVTNYENALKGSGAEPIVITSAEFDVDDFDGLLLPGGADIDPARYGQENIASEGVNERRDELQFQVLDAFVRAKKPVFGICRGHQVINVYFGGTLIQNLDSSERHSRMGGCEDKAHSGTAEEGSFLADIYGHTFSVNSSHHQAVERAGEGLQIAMLSDDGVVEALKHVELPIWSVQWHPERICFAHRREDTVDGSLVLRFFVDRCCLGKA